MPLLSASDLNAAEVPAELAAYVAQAPGMRFDLQVT